MEIKETDIVNYCVQYGCSYDTAKIALAGQLKIELLEEVAKKATKKKNKNKS